MHISKSETHEIFGSLGDKKNKQMPASLPRVRIRVNRVRDLNGGEIPNYKNLTYEELIQINCDRFLSSESVHQWLSELNLCKKSANYNWRQFETSEMGVQCDFPTDLNKKKKFILNDACTSNNSKFGDSKQEYLSAPQYSEQLIYNGLDSRRSSLKNNSNFNSGPLIENSYMFLEGNLNGFRTDKLSDQRGDYIPKTKNTDPFLAADFLTSSFLTTTTNTSETQVSEMDLYRRASYLEEYVLCKVKELEKAEALENSSKTKTRKWGRKFWDRLGNTSNTILYRLHRCLDLRKLKRKNWKPKKKSSEEKYASKSIWNLVQQRFKTIFLDPPEKKQKKFEEHPDVLLKSSNAIRKVGIRNIANTNQDNKKFSTNLEENISEESQRNLLKNCNKNFMIITSFV